MLCVTDVGNTQTVIGIYEGETLIYKWRVHTDPKRTTDEWGLTFHSLFNLSNLNIKSITGMIISSVVPPALHAIKRAGLRYFNVSPIIIGPGMKTGMALRIDNPKEIGADRIVNSIAAYLQLKSACIVVDFGTAITFDCISNKGEYLGGAIAPGLKTSLNALVSNTAKLPKVEIQKPSTAIGKNTIEAMQSGIVYGYAAMVDGIVKRLTKEMGCKVKVLATGGLAGVVSTESSTIDSVKPNLTLEGLRLIYQRNAKTK